VEFFALADLCHSRDSQFFGGVDHFFACASGLSEMLFSIRIPTNSAQKLRSTPRSAAEFIWRAVGDSLSVFRNIHLPAAREPVG
jgi:hypothetical protein